MFKCAVVGLAVVQASVFGDEEEHMCNMKMIFVGWDSRNLGL